MFSKEPGEIWVKGAKDTSELKCEECGSWIDHWKKLAGEEKVYCCHPDHIEARPKLADRGAHVKKQYTPKDKPKMALSPSDRLDIESQTLFIIPVCEEHNIDETESILVPKKFLVSAKPCKKGNNLRLGIRKNIQIKKG